MTRTPASGRRWNWFRNSQGAMFPSPRGRIIIEGNPHPGEFRHEPHATNLADLRVLPLGDGRLAGRRRPGPGSRPSRQKAGGGQHHRLHAVVPGRRSWGSCSDCSSLPKPAIAATATVRRDTSRRISWPTSRLGPERIFRCKCKPVLMPRRKIRPPPCLSPHLPGLTHPFSTPAPDRRVRNFGG